MADSADHSGSLLEKSGIRDRREQRRRKLAEQSSTAASPTRSKREAHSLAYTVRARTPMRALFGVGPRSRLDSALIWGSLAIVLVTAGALLSYWWSILAAAEEELYFFIGPDAPREAARREPLLALMREIGYKATDTPAAAHLVWAPAGGHVDPSPRHADGTHRWINIVRGTEALASRGAREEILRRAAAISASLNVTRPATWLLGKGEWQAWLDAHRAASQEHGEAWWALDGPSQPDPGGAQDLAGACVQPVAEWGDAAAWGAATAAEVPREAAMVGGRRVTLRVLVLITSRVPLRAYLHRRGWSPSRPARPSAPRPPARRGRRGPRRPRGG